MATDTINRIIIIVGIILLLPALLINLGLLPLIDDEAIRALVAIEMDLKNDYITPTLANNLYFKKPPVYNWILLLNFKLTGSYSEWAVRFPNILFLLGYGFSIYALIRRRVGDTLAIVAAAMFVSTGRVLFYESFHGLIDISYSWLLFCNFIWMYNLREKRKHLQLFLVSYLVTGITFLMKGIPSIAFQGITLLVLFTGNGEFKRLFSWKHMVGIIVFIIITGSYYLAYYLNNAEFFFQLLDTLFSESADKSVTGSGFKDIAVHFIRFPAEVFYHFLPWTLLAWFFFTKTSRDLIKQNGFLRYLLQVFLFNILIYWVSPVTYPRYILMLVPLLFIVLAVLYYENIKVSEKTEKRCNRILLVISMVLCSVHLVIPVTGLVRFIPWCWEKSIVLFIVSAGVLVFVHFRFRKQLVALILLLFILRISFNYFVMPYRAIDCKRVLTRESAQLAGQLTKGEQLFGLCGLNYHSYYYLTVEREQIVNFVDQATSEGFYIINDPEQRYDSLKYAEIVMPWKMHRVSLIKLQFDD
jgi:4-amino-4-deoxy-L-arabinose transferase-like glycosyltransferase